MAEAPVTLETCGTLLRLVLDDPPRNTMNRRFFDAFSRVVEEELPGIQAEGMIVHGRHRHFSAGADIEELTADLCRSGDARAIKALRRSTMDMQALSNLPFPVVAALSGCCFGSALELAMACHYRIASRNAVLASPECTFGLMPGCGQTVRLPTAVGVGPAIDLILTGRMLSAEEACRMGIVDRVVEKDELLDTAEAMIHALNRVDEGRPCEDPPG